jgi:putative membrane protein
LPVTYYTYVQYTEPPWDYDVPWGIRIAVRWLITVIGFVFAEWFVNDVWYSGAPWFMDGWMDLFIAALMYVFMRAIFRPILIFLTCPLQIITLGLFLFVVNAMILIITEEVCGWFGVGFSVDGFWPAFIGALVISLVSFAISRFLRRNPFSRPAEDW